jgi:pimeloyl-ACP methyl ester carboxylesterase
MDPGMVPLMLAHFSIPHRNSNPLVILHGLLGSKQNWLSISKQLHKQLERTIIALDLRNHGDSFHHPIHTYDAMAADVLDYIQAQGYKKVSMMGHSMGGKVGMALAIQQPNIMDKLCVVDMAPTSNPISHEIRQFFMYFREIEKAKMTISEAGSYLKERVPNESTRLFLMTNYKRLGESYGFRVNLDALEDSLNHLGTFQEGSSNVETLFIRGSKSGYVPDSSFPAIQKAFPNSSIRTIEAGHWVHFEQPTEFIRTCHEFFC